MRVRLDVYCLGNQMFTSDGDKPAWLIIVLVIPSAIGGYQSRRRWLLLRKRKRKRGMMHISLIWHPNWLLCY